MIKYDGLLFVKLRSTRSRHTCRQLITQSSDPMHCMLYHISEVVLRCSGAVSGGEKAQSLIPLSQQPKFDDLWHFSTF